MSAYKVVHSFTREEQLASSKPSFAEQIDWAEHGRVRDVLKIKQIERRIRRKLLTEELNDINLSEAYGVQLYKMPFDLLERPREAFNAMVKNAKASGFVTLSTLGVDYETDGPTSVNENENV